MNFSIVKSYITIHGDENNIVDLGAQVGIYSKFLWEAFGTRCKSLVSVEPHPENCVKIRQLISEYGASEKWVVDECAVDIHDGESDFEYLRTGAGEPLGSFILDDLFPPLKKEDYVDKIEHLRVKTKTMQKICPEPHIVKIDIEGLEYAVLPEILRLPSVYALIIEFSHIPFPSWEKNGYRLEDYLMLLYHKGFKRMCGHTESKDGYIFFHPLVLPSLRWEDLQPYPYNKCFHVLAQKESQGFPTIFRMVG